MNQESNASSGPLRFCLEGDFSSPLASGRYIRELVLAARGIEMPLAIKFYPTIPHCEEMKLAPLVTAISQRPPTGRVRVVCQPSFLLPENVERGVYWAISAFDAQHPTKPELDRLKAADRLWLPSEAHAKAVQAIGIGRERITVLMAPVNPKVFYPRARVNEILEKDGRFTFLFIGNPLRRKGLDLALRAYLEEFKANEHVRLVIKLTHLPKVKKHFSFEITDLAKRLGALNKMFPEVQIIDSTMEDHHLAGLMTGCNALVSTNRAYYTGLGIHEARAVGLPIIGPVGLQQFFDFHPKTGFPVKTHTVPCQEGDLYKDSPASMVEEVDIPDLRLRMREAFKSAGETKRRGKNALDGMKRHPNWKGLAANLLMAGAPFARTSPSEEPARKPFNRSAHRSAPRTETGPQKVSRPDFKPSRPPRDHAKPRPARTGPEKFGPSRREKKP